MTSVGFHLRLSCLTFVDTRIISEEALTNTTNPTFRIETKQNLDYPNQKVFVPFFFFSLCFCSFHLLWKSNLSSQISAKVSLSLSLPVSSLSSRGAEMVSRLSVLSGQCRGSHLDLGSATPSLRGPASLGGRAAPRARRWPRGRGSRLDAHLAGIRRSRRHCHWEDAKTRSPHGGNARALGQTRDTFRPVCKDRRRRTMGAGIGLQRCAHPTRAAPTPPLLLAAPTPPHFQSPFCPRQRKEAKVGIA